MVTFAHTLLSQAAFPLTYSFKVGKTLFWFALSKVDGKNTTFQLETKVTEGISD